MKYKAITLNKILYLAIIAFSILTSLLVLSDYATPDYYANLYLLPLSYFLLCIFFVRLSNISISNITVWMIIVLYFVRNVFNPFIMRLENYSGLLKITTYHTVNNAVSLMIYETFMVFVTLYLVSRNNKYKSNIKERKYGGKVKINIVYSIVFILFVFCFASYVLIPEVRANFNTIFNSGSLINDNYSMASARISYGTIKRIVFSLSLFLFPIVQVSMGIILFIKIRKKFGNKFISIIISMLCLFINFLFISDNNMQTLYVALVQGLILIKMYPKYKIVLIQMVIGFFAIGILIILLAKMDSLSSFDRLSMTFQAYFQGVGNVAGVFNINNSNKASTLFYDFYYMIPFRNTLFNLSGDRLVIVFNKSNNVASQILPFIGQVYHYLGFVLAPIFSVIFTFIAVKIGNKIKHEENIFRYAYYILLVLHISFTLVSNNLTIFGMQYLTFLLPLYMLSTITGKNSTFKSVDYHNIKEEIALSN